MTQHFRQTVQELWQFAKLGSPQFAQNGTASLTFDDVTLVLSVSPNEEDIWVTANAGPLPNAQVGQTDQLQKILGLSFALLASHDVLVTIEENGIKVSGSYPLQARNLPRLSDILSDVVSATETLQRVVTQGTGETMRQAVQPFPQGQEFVVFQP